MSVPILMPSTLPFLEDGEGGVLSHPLSRSHSRDRKGRAVSVRCWSHSQSPQGGAGRSCSIPNPDPIHNAIPEREGEGAVGLRSRPPARSHPAGTAPVPSAGEGADPAPGGAVLAAVLPRPSPIPSAGRAVQPHALPVPAHTRRRHRERRHRERGKEGSNPGMAWSLPPS